jgi:hypothetical protein
MIEEFLRLHIGNPQEPRASFYPMLTGIVIAGLSVHLSNCFTIPVSGDAAEIYEPSRGIAVE